MEGSHRSTFRTVVGLLYGFTRASAKKSAVRIARIRYGRIVIVQFTGTKAAKSIFDAIRKVTVMTLDPGFEPFVDEVEKVNGLPIVLSRYGFKTEELNGKKYLVAASKDELEAEMPSGSELAIGCFSRSDGKCDPSGCMKCKGEYRGGLWVCICRD